VSALCRCQAVMGPVAVVAPVGCTTDVDRVGVLCLVERIIRHAIGL